MFPLSKILAVLLLLIVFNSCKEKSGYIAPGVNVVQPYTGPVCHPNGKIVVFNHYPLKEIIYYNGYDCPLDATYKYDSNNSGFWIMNIDGSNPRRALSHFLYGADWSPDGKWIAFFSGGNIFKMRFDGEEFDTTSIIQLTTGGRNYNPSWSPDSRYIAYDNTECGTAVEPIPENSCGVLIMDSTGNNRVFIKQGRFPFWRSVDTLYYNGMNYYDLINKSETRFFNNVKLNFTTSLGASFNYKKNLIFFVGKFNDRPGSLNLYSVDPRGNNFRIISTDPILEFTCTLDGKIIYLLYDDERIDNEYGTLWIMDENGQNKKQLTYNHFIVTSQ